jgi:hypoxanthine phosphoribosyltransferase
MMQQTTTAHGRTFQLLLGEDAIRERVQQLGLMIRERYEGRRPLFLGVLNGAFVFAADLIRAAGIECEISFIKLSSYRGTKSSGQVATVIGLEVDLAGREVILVEDIVDSGKTLHSLLPELKELGPASVAIAAFLLKPDALVYPVSIDFLGFDIPDKFVIGYGLDYDGLGRNLPGIYQLEEAS